jgi:hypothetical protein
VSTVNDTVFEASENYTLSGVGTSGTVTGTATIIDNDSVPATAGGYASGVEDTLLTLKWSDFNASDADTPVAQLSIKITTLPGDGQLHYNGVAVTQAQVNGGLVISKADIDGGKLQFKPDGFEASDIAGNGGGTQVGNREGDYARFDYQVSDGTNLSPSAKFVVDIVAVANAPTLSLLNPDSTLQEGLLLERWSNLNLAYNNGNGVNPDSVEAAIEKAGAASSSVIQQSAAFDTASTSLSSRLSGLIYLEAGKSYTFSGTADDSVRLEVGGVTVASATWSGVGQHEQYSGQFTATANGWYTLTAFHDNEAGPGSFSLNVAVGSGQPKPLNTANFDIVSDVSKLNGVVNLNTYVGHSSKEGGYYPQLATNTGLEDSWIVLSRVSASLQDIDGSERLSLSLSGLPEGSQLKDGLGKMVTVGKDGKVNLDGWNLGSLQFKGPQDYHGVLKLQVTATATESSNLDEESTIRDLVVTVLPTNDAPAVTASDTAVVSEAGVFRALSGSDDSSGADSKVVDSGKLTVSDSDSSQLSVMLDGPAGLTSGGSAITWAMSGQTLVGSANGQRVLEVKLTPPDASGKGEWDYEVTLKGSVDHSAAGQEDTLRFELDVRVSDGQLTTVGKLPIVIEDGSPKVVTPQSGHIEGASIQTNLMLIVDVSGSMTRVSGVEGKSRLDIAKESLLTLLNQYDALGATAVRIVLFSDVVSTLGNGWLTVAEAKEKIWGLQINDNRGTEYDVGINEAMKSFLSTQGKLSGNLVQNVSYFLSDGDPATGHGVPESSWTNFTKQYDINSYALGMGSEIVNPDSLNKAAYNGVSEKNTDAILVTDMSKLEQVISDTALRVASGDLFGQAGTGAGADGGAISSVRVDGHTYTIEKGRLVSGADQGGSYDALHQQLVINLGNGDKLTIGLVTGEYLYQTSQHGAQSKTIGFDLMDSDGDKVTGVLNLTIESSDNGRTFAGNDGDDHLTVLNASQVYITLGGVHGGGAHTMTEENVATDAGVTLYGGKGYDHLTGGQGDDVLVGGSNGHGSSGPINKGGTLYYGDVLTGGDGADTFLWQQGDALELGSNSASMTPGHAIDYITDFHVEHASGWQKSSNSMNAFKSVDIAHSDKLDLSDMLDPSGSQKEADISKLLSAFEKTDGVHLQVGAVGGSKVSQEIVLLGHTFESITGDNDVSGSMESASQQVISYMLQNHLLDIDK